MFVFMLRLWVGDIAFWRLQWQPGMKQLTCFGLWYLLGVPHWRGPLGIRVGAKPSLWCAWCSSMIVWYGQPGTYSATGVSYTLLMWCQLMCAFVELPLFISAYCRLIFWCVCTLCYLEFCVCHPKRAVQWILNLHYWSTYFTHSMWQAFMIESLELKECLD